MSLRGLRTRAFLENWFGVVAVILLVAAGAGGYAAYHGYVAPDSSTELRVADAWTRTGGFEHSATVQNGNEAFEEGARLENRTVYFASVAPVLDGTFEYGFDATENGSLDVQAELVLVVRSVSDDPEGETVEYWRVTEPLTNQTASLAPGESVSLSFSRNVSALAERARRIEADLGTSTGVTETLVVARVEATGTANARPVDVSDRYVLPVAVSQATYRVENPGVRTNKTEAVERVPVTDDDGPVSRIGGPALAGASLLALLALPLLSRTGRLGLSPGEREWLAYRSARREFDDWITAALVPGDALDGRPVETASLEGLVDLAIDTDGRVLEDRERDRYLVFDGDAAYVYYPPRTADRSDADPLGADD